MNPKAAAAIQSLSRIRVAETKEADGSRRVWHQGVDVDLLSHVDCDGKLQRQELTLFEDYFVWGVGQGLRTGTTARGVGSAAAGAAENLVLDCAVSRERLAGAEAALKGYGGDDRYILHIRHVIGMLLRGREERDEVVITVIRELPSELQLEATRPRFPLMLIVGVAVALIVVAVLAMLLF
ncbi:MAG: hypothetical protein HY901_12665 [Deltaproteobacteria bacterium]|nr:hypothetical protein [Deltaproteobacteria bacterium]